MLGGYELGLEFLYFDEMFPCTDHGMGEHRAFMEVSAKYGVTSSWIDCLPRLHCTCTEFGFDRGTIQVGYTRTKW